MREDAFMGFVRKNIYTEKFDDTDEKGVGNKFYLAANGTFPLIACKFQVNITLYNLDGITTYCYYLL